MFTQFTIGDFHKFAKLIKSCDIWSTNTNNILVIRG